EDAARAALERWMPKLAGTKGLEAAAASHVAAAARKHRAKGDWEKALACIEAHKSAVPAARLAGLSVSVYDAWAQPHMKKGEWKEAAAIYGKGLAALPGNAHLKKNLDYCKERLR
ncbi:MAG: hypothetical protein K2W96_20950, partial [Gemmataceae bacterium]|nr:hypothetical protein [Gemmataceae bacterium]